jgi:hypothetical protein
MELARETPVAFVRIAAKTDVLAHRDQG